MGGKVRVALREQAVGRAVEHAIPSHCRAKRAVRSKQPGPPATPAEACGRQPVGISALVRRPGDASVEVAHDLRVRDAQEEVGDECRHIGKGGGVALPHHQVGRHSQEARVRAAPRDVCDVLM